jgi:peptide/nickel transport system permease protein
MFSTMQHEQVSAGLWLLAWRRLRADRVAMAALAVVGLFLLTLLLSASGLLAGDWAAEVGVSYAPPAFVGAPPAGVEPAAETGHTNAPVDTYGIADPLQQELEEIHSQQHASAASTVAPKATLPFGADKWGHDIVKKTIKGGETSIVVGLVAALLATFLGTLFGALSGYFGRWVDDLFNWFYSIFTSVPYLLLILAVAAVLQKKGVLTIVLILGLTGWTGAYRLVRAEYIKHKAREYVMAADAIGASHWRKMFSHIFPNISHVALVQMSILVVGFIKSEVILSFLGFGVPVGVVSWGSMLNEAQNELILGKWWQLAAASSAMALLVTAFSLLTDGLRDALDPKLK